MLNGFDVSHWQGSENWASMKSAYGLSFGFAKAMQGESTRDDRFAANWSGMKSAGLVRGAYYFAEPDTNPDDDASAFLNFVNPTDPTDLLVLDLESTTITADQTAAYAYGFGEAIRRLTGNKYNPGIYCGGYADVYAYREMLEYFGWWWYPRYPSKYANKTTWPTSMADCIPPDPNTFGKWPPDIWQFSQSFPVGGEAHDANVFNGTLEQLRALNTGEDMPLTDADAIKVAETVWNRWKVYEPDGTTQKTYGQAMSTMYQGGQKVQNSGLAIETAETVWNRWKVYEADGTLQKTYGQAMSSMYQHATATGAVGQAVRSSVLPLLILLNIIAIVLLVVVVVRQ